MFRIVVLNLNGYGQKPTSLIVAGDSCSTEQEAYDTFMKASNYNRGLRYSHLLMVENQKTGSRRYITQACIKTKD